MRMTVVAQCVAVALVLTGCGDANDGEPVGATTITLESDLGLGGESVFVHWTDDLGGSIGREVSVGAWSEGSDEFVLSTEGLHAPAEMLLDLRAAGYGSGSASIAWLHVGPTDAMVASAADAVLLELTADEAGDSFIGRLVGGPLSAGVHLLDVRPWTDAELAEFEACMAGAADPDLECPALKMHLSRARDDRVRLVQGEDIPDLS